MKTRVGLWLGAIASLLSSAAATVVCPACIPVGGALLASAGLGFALSAEFMRGLLVALLAVSVGSLGWAVRRHGRRSVLAVGTAGAALIYLGRHVWFSPPLMWTGAVVLICASLVNVRVKRDSCGCAQRGNKSAYAGGADK